MIAALGAVWRGLRRLMVAGYALIWANVAFVVLSLPLVTLPAAFRALMHVAMLSHTSPSDADLGTFWETFRASLWRALPWGVGMALVGGINYANLLRYAGLSDPIFMLLRGVWLLVGLVWMGVALFTWPIYDAMPAPTVGGAARNAAIMVLRNPLFTLIVAGACAVLASLSMILPAAWLLLTFGAVASIAAAAVQDRLAALTPDELPNGALQTSHAQPD